MHNNVHKCCLCWCKVVFMVMQGGTYGNAWSQCAAFTAGVWVKIGSDVGWSAKGNGYGTVKVPQKLCATEVKFVYKSGHVACRAGQCITPAHVI